MLFNLIKFYSHISLANMLSEYVSIRNETIIKFHSSIYRIIIIIIIKLFSDWQSIP